MKKLTLCIILLVVFVGQESIFADTTKEQSNTHLKIGPGKVTLDELVQQGEEYELLRYKVINSSDETKEVSITSTGNIVVENKTITLKQGEEYFFDSKIKIPKGEYPGKKSDFVVVKTEHDGENSLKLSAKVDYEVEERKLDSSYIISIPFILFIPLFIILWFLFKKRKETEKKEK